MAEELGKIEKPEAEQFKEKRKLYLVPLLYSWQDAPAEYSEKLNLYWQQVREHISNLELKAGRINRVFHESITVAGEEGLKVLEKLNPASCRITSAKCQNGAELELTEDRELAEENMDWERHLLMGFISQKVAKTVSDLLAEASRKRYEYIASRMDEAIKENEVAILFIREGHMLQFPPDLEVFMVSPPALDDIRRWLRDYTPAELKEEKDESQTASEPD